MSYSETKELVDLTYNFPIEEARDIVFRRLASANFTEGQFHDAIEEHAPTMNLTSEQWLRLFQMYQNIVFHSRFDLSKLLSENHLRQLMNELE